MQCNVPETSEECWPLTHS